AAGVGSGPPGAAVEAVPGGAAQRGGAAARRVMQHLALHGRQPAAVALPKRLAVFANPLRHFQSRPLQKGGAHARPSAGATDPVGRGSTSRSSKLGVCCKRWVLTCRYRAVVSRLVCPSSAL